MREFIDANLRGATFENADLGAALFRRVDLTDARFNAVDFTGVVMRGVDLCDMDIRGEIQNLTINGVDVGPLIEAELDARYPLRSEMRPTDADGFRSAWEILDALWNDTVERAGRLDRELLHASVNGEWSFIETLRHLIFATDSWVKGVIWGDPAPWDALGLPWDEMPDVQGIPRDRTARPSLEVVLALRRDRMSSVRGFLAELTDQSLDEQTVPLNGPGWPPTRSFPVRQCLRIVLNEEWEHRLYAERDLAVLETGGATAQGARGGTSRSTP